MDQLHQRADQRQRLDPERILPLDLGQQRLRIAFEQRGEQPALRALVGKPEHVAHPLGGDLAARVSRSAWAIAWSRIDSPSRTEPSAAAAIIVQRLGFGLDAFLARRCSAKCSAQHRRGDAAQVEALAARQHRDRQLVDLGGGEQELHMRRRFLKCLEQAR